MAEVHTRAEKAQSIIPAVRLDTPELAIPQPASEAAQAAYAAVASASNTVNLSADCFAKLASIFSAIAQLTPEHLNTHQLARVGSLLADDFSDTCNGECEELEAHFKAFHAAIYPKKEGRNHA